MLEKNRNSKFESVEIRHPITGEVWCFKGDDYSKLNLKDYSKVEMTKGDQIIYGFDEIGPIFEIYGKDSEIYNAMADGKVVSGMIEKSMKKNQEAGNNEIVKREETLLARCLIREREYGINI